MGGRRDDVEAVLRAVERQRAAPGLVIDVRGNGGGSRAILRGLMPHLMAADARPVVVNVASYRLPPDTRFDAERGHLENRFLHPPGSRAFTEAERAVVRETLGAIEVDLELAPSRFTPLHAMVISPAPAGAWRFAGPVAVLIDAGCYSATDIFVGALELLPTVTVVGTPTGGGSGRARRYRLKHSGLEFKLSSMASFRPSGRRYDGVGIEPDVRVEHTLESFVADQDPVLERALEVLRTKRGG
jgi:C-terminal processing protease CtpA/Prc